MGRASAGTFVVVAASFVLSHTILLREHWRQFNINAVCRVIVLETPLLHSIPGSCRFIMINYVILMNDIVIIPETVC